MNYCDVQQQQCDIEIKILDIEEHIFTYIEVKPKQNPTRVKRQDRLGEGSGDWGAAQVGLSGTGDALFLHLCIHMGVTL